MIDLNKLLKDKEFFSDFSKEVLDFGQLEDLDLENISGGLRNFSNEFFERTKEVTDFLELPTLNEAGDWLVGYGHKISQDMVSMFTDIPIDLGEAETFLREDLGKIEDLIKSKVDVPLNQNQFDSLVGFGHAVGEEELEKSGVIESVNNQDYGQAAQAMNCYKNKGGTYDQETAARIGEYQAGIAPDAGVYSAAEQPPTPVGDIPKSDTIDAIKQASIENGVDYETMLAIGYTESSLNPNAKNPNSSASGTYQFVDNTWLEMVKKHGDSHAATQGLGQYIEYDPNSRRNVIKSGTPPGIRDKIMGLKNNPGASSHFGAKYLKDNISYVQNRTGQQLTTGDQYLTHFLGPGGATKVIGANPATPVNEIPGFSNAIAANPNIMKPGGRYATAGELRDWANKKMSVGKSLAEQHPIDGSKSV